MRGSAMLLISSIVMIILTALSGISIIVLMVLLKSVPSFSDLANQYGLGDFNVSIIAQLDTFFNAISSMITFVGILALLAGLFPLITGIIGIINCKNPDKAKLCFILGLVLSILQGIGTIAPLIGSLITAIASGGAGLVTTVFIALPLATAIFYTVGAGQLKQG